MWTVRTTRNSTRYGWCIELDEERTINLEMFVKQLKRWFKNHKFRKYTMHYNFFFICCVSVWTRSINYLHLWQFDFAPLSLYNYDFLLWFSVIVAAVVSIRIASAPCSSTSLNAAFLSLHSLSFSFVRAPGVVRFSFFHFMCIDRFTLTHSSSRAQTNCVKCRSSCIDYIRFIKKPIFIFVEPIRYHYIANRQAQHTHTHKTPSGNDGFGITLILIRSRYYLMQFEFGGVKERQRMRLPHLSSFSLEMKKNSVWICVYLFLCFPFRPVLIYFGCFGN